jgi:hypothetical protein
MPIPKLFLYKAADAPVAILLRRGESRDQWELIRWDLETDTFTAGQWLLGKHLHGKDAALSPDGRFLAYQYDIYSGEAYQSHAAVSLVPNFTAVLHNPGNGGHWDTVGFTADGSLATTLKTGWVVPPGTPAGTPPGYEIRHGARDEKVASGYVENETWVDPRGRVITLNGAQVVANGVVLYDAADHVFQSRPPVWS